MGKRVQGNHGSATWRWGGGCVLQHIPPASSWSTLLLVCRHGALSPPGEDRPDTSCVKPLYAEIPPCWTEQNSSMRRYMLFLIKLSRDGVGLSHIIDINPPNTIRPPPLPSIPIYCVKLKSMTMPNQCRRKRLKRNCMPYSTCQLSNPFPQPP